jgi:hypothetical protein
VSAARVHNAASTAKVDLNHGTPKEAGFVTTTKKKKIFHHLAIMF